MPPTHNMVLRPFFNRVGSKRQYVKRLSEMCPKSFDSKRHTYFEPFLGTGAMLLYLQPKKAKVADLDSTVIEAFLNMRRSSQSVKAALQRSMNSRSLKQTYGLLCHQFIGLTSIKRTASFIFLSKYSYGSLVKFTKDGQRIISNFRSERPQMDWDNFDRVAKFLKASDIRMTCETYLNSTRTATRGDFVFLDPPYTKVSHPKQYYEHKSVTRQHLAAFANSLHERGCLVMLINSADLHMESLLPGWKIHSFVATEKFSHKPRHESVIINYTI